MGGQLNISRTTHLKSSLAESSNLGMEANITRRDFLGSALLASGSALLGGVAPAELLAQNDDFTGYGGIGDYSTANGNTLDVLEQVMRFVTARTIHFQGHHRYRRALRLRRHWWRN